MSYNTFLFLKRAIDAELAIENSRAEHAFCLFKSASEKARRQASKLSLERIDELEHMKAELKFAASESNRNHPNPKMREFWNV
mgnify:CR=1 FL=1